MAEIQENLKMKAVIFAGGVGTRMWPVSRTNFPKQFEKIIQGKSTLQLTVAHLRPEFKWEDIYISTNVSYVKIIQKQLPRLPKSNIIGEPVRRDVAPAVGYLMTILEKKGDRPTLILWSDHLRKNLAAFKKMLKAGQKYLVLNPNKFLFIGEKPRFANQNLGWIETGKKSGEIDGLSIHRFKSLKYQPDLSLAEKFFRAHNYYWNPGYWLVKPSLVLEQYRKFKPEMYKQLEILGSSFGKAEHSSKLKKIYPTLEKISFDKAILEKLDPEKAEVMVVDMGWSDVGTWQALKEALQKEAKANVVYGKTYSFESEDNLVYSYTPQLVTTVGLKGTVVVVTKDVVLVCQQNAMAEVKKLVEIFEKDKNYQKYT